MTMEEQTNNNKLQERLQRFCELRGQQTEDTGISVIYKLDTGVNITIYNVPLIRHSGLRNTHHDYGLIERTNLPKGSLGRWRYIDDKAAQYMYKILGERIEELERRLKENEV